MWIRDLSEVASPIVQRQSTINNRQSATNHRSKIGKSKMLYGCFVLPAAAASSARAPLRMLRIA
jgi:hypothetical protein